MGRVNSESQKEPTTNHFGHPHPLKLCNYHPQQTSNLSSSCSGCKLEPSGLIYTCTTCNYFLHKKCFEMPKKITHPCHKEHSFTLLPEPAYAEGLFNCDACMETGDGFSYHCKPCGIDLHILCAVMPLSLSHPSHVHKLDLNFEPPHLSKMFCCDVCKNTGVMNHWLYRCNSCDFDAHLNCARGVNPVQSQSQGQQNNFMGFQSQGQLPPQAATFSRSAPQPPPGFGPHYVAPRPPPPPGFGPHYVAPSPPPLQQSFMPPSPMMVNNPAVGVPAGSPIRTNPYEASRQNNELFLQALQQMINNNHAMTQAILAGSAGGFGSGGVSGFPNGGGGGGYGGDNRMQQLMQLFSSINANGGTTGGGGFPGMNANAFGGGAGGQDFLQALTNNIGGGSGGGMDILQSILGGGSGLDFLGGALGGFNF